MHTYIYMHTYIIMLILDPECNLFLTTTQNRPFKRFTVENKCMHLESIFLEALGTQHP